MSIFVSIASFCDPVLDFTVYQALKQASRLHEIYFGVVEQNYSATKLKNVYPNVSYVLVDPAHSMGACWARALAMSLYDGEDWFFQIDSHTYFEKNWDETLIRQAQELANQRGDNNFIMSSYPRSFNIEENSVIKTQENIGILAHVVKQAVTFESNTYTLTFEAHPHQSSSNVQGFHLAGGCLFTMGYFVHKFPYDPQLYFIGEEQSMALRLFTHGWDIYHPVELPIYHLYNNENNKQPRRELHWDSKETTGRETRSLQLQHKSQKRLSNLINRDSSLGVYGLGINRTLLDYANFSGIDYINKNIDPIAYKGYWKS